MFNQKYKKSTTRLIVCWATVCFIYYGIMILLPTILAKVYSSEDVNIKYIFLMVVSLFEVAGFFVARMVIDHPRVSRKRGVYLGLLLISVSSFLAIFTRESILGLFLLMAVMKLVISATFMILYPYTA